MAFAAFARSLASQDLHDYQDLHDFSCKASQGIQRMHSLIVAMLES
jgi:hypothetical protein